MWNILDSAVLRVLSHRVYPVHLLLVSRSLDEVVNVRLCDDFKQVALNVALHACATGEGKYVNEASAYLQITSEIKHTEMKQQAHTSRGRHFRAKDKVRKHQPSSRRGVSVCYRWPCLTFNIWRTNRTWSYCREVKVCISLFSYSENFHTLKVSKFLTLHVAATFLK